MNDGLQAGSERTRVLIRGPLAARTPRVHHDGRMLIAASTRGRSTS